MSLQLFKQLFAGRTDVYGTGKGLCVKESLTDEIVSGHINGDRRIGVYPVFNSTFTNFIAIDVDRPEFDLVQRFMNRCRHYEINGYIERSKSKGHHVFVFFDKPYNCTNARLVIEMILEEIELKTEIFPKQDYVGEGAYGNYINLPLFGGDVRNERTVFVDENNNVIIYNIAQLEKIKLTSTKIFDDLIELNDLKRRSVAEISDASRPRHYARELPCITKIKEGVGAGERNEAAFRFGVHLKNDKALTFDEAATILGVWNKKNTPPLLAKELSTILNSIYQGKYKPFMCSSGIIGEKFCDKETCPVIQAQKRNELIQKGVITLTFRDEEIMVFAKNAYEYRLSGIEVNKRRRVICSLTLLRAKQLVYKDIISLSRASNRKKFEVASKDPSIDHDLVEIEDLVIKQMEKEEKEKLDKPKQQYIMSEVEKKEALAYLSDTKDILRRVVDTTAQMGIIGEESIRLMVYLCFTSSMTESPLSITIKGESSSGKSYIPGKVKQLVPEERYFFITRATQNAFYHLEEDAMQHKIIMISELPGAESADYSIRTAQSEGDLVLMIPKKDPSTGEIVTESKTVKGPVGFLMTTTKASLFDENETRNFSLFTDDSPELTRRTKDITIRKAKGETFEVEDKILNLWKNAQRLLNSDFKVIIPYAEEVFENFPDKPVRIRRDRERFRVLIDIVTLLHQYHRRQWKNEGVKFLESTLADYHLAKFIAEHTLLETIYEIGPASRIVWSKVLGMRKEFLKDDLARQQEDFLFTYKDVMGIVDWSYSKTKKWVLPLLKSGVIDYSSGGPRPGRGRMAEFVISDRMIAKKDSLYGNIINEQLSGLFLPAVLTLFEKYPCDQALFYNPYGPEFSLYGAEAMEGPEEAPGNAAGGNSGDFSGVPEGDGKPETTQELKEPQEPQEPNDWQKRATGDNDDGVEWEE